MHKSPENSTGSGTPFWLWTYMTNVVGTFSYFSFTTSLVRQRMFTLRKVIFIEKEKENLADTMDKNTTLRALLKKSELNGTT